MDNNEEGYSFSGDFDLGKFGTEITMDVPNEMEIDIKSSDFVLDGMVTGAISTTDVLDNPEVMYEITSAEIIEKLNKLFGKYPVLVTKIKNNLDGVINTINNEFKTQFSIIIDFRLVLDCDEGLKEVCDFLDLVSCGVLVSHGYEKVVPCNVKVFLSDKDRDINIIKTNLGYIHSGIPMINGFTRSEINGTIGKFYKDKLLDMVSNQDYYEYFISCCDTEVVVNPKVAIEEMSDVELAMKLLKGELTVEQIRSNSHIAKKRANNIVILSKLRQFDTY